MDRRVFLKVKLKSLTAEARIIKREEDKRKVPRYRRDSRHLHNIAQGVGPDEAIETRKMSQERSQERRNKAWYGRSAEELHQLHLHRIQVVRREARVTNIAYAIVRGRALSRVDSMKGLTEACMAKIHKMVGKYGDADSADVKDLLSHSPRDSLILLNQVLKEQEAA